MAESSDGGAYCPRLLPPTLTVGAFDVEQDEENGFDVAEEDAGGGVLESASGARSSARNRYTV